MAFDLSITEKWLDATMSADIAIVASSVSVYILQAPQNAVMPYIIIAFSAGADINTMGSRGLAQPLYIVKAVGKHEHLPVLRVAADRIDALLQDTQVVVSGYHIRVQRETPLHYVENVEGVEYRHLGGMYRCWVSPAA